MTQLLPPKKEVALALLERSNVDIYLDPRARGVVVPPQFRKEPRLILKIGLNMPVPIPDLRLDDESMSCTLSFNRSPFYCVVPWPSVFAMVGDDGRGMVWPDDVPQELSVRVAEEQRPRGDAPPPSSGNGARGKRAPRALEAAPDSGSGGGGKKKGQGKKKKDEGRPLLMAVPAPPPSDPKLEAKSTSETGVKADARTEERRRESTKRREPEQTKLRLEEPPPKDDVIVADEPGPQLSLTERAPSKEAPVDAAADAEEAKDAKDADAKDDAPRSVPPSRGATPSGRPKRELPPYLRVVK